MNRRVTQFSSCLLCLVALLLLSSCTGIAQAPGNAISTPAVSHSDDGDGVPPIPLPTVPPAAELLESALAHRSMGKDHAAAEELRTLLDIYPNVPEARQASYYLAESLARRGRWASAIEAFELVLNDATQDDLTIRAFFWVARGYESTGDWANAIEHYERYRAFNTPLEPYAAIRQAAQHQQIGEAAEAAQSFEHGARSDINRAERAASYERAIALRKQLGQDEEALQLYRELLAIAQLPNYRARILSEAATLAMHLGQINEALDWSYEIVTIAPISAEAVSAVQYLLNARDARLSHAKAARLLFDNGAYDAALPLLDEAIAQLHDTPGDAASEELLELQRLQAMAIRETGNYSEALKELETIGEASPDSAAGRQAQLDAIQTLGQSGEVAEAATAYQEYASRYPDDPRAAEALDRSAQLLDRLGKTREATQVRLDLGWRYPNNPRAIDALHTAAFSLWHQGLFNEALAAWQQLANNSAGVERACAAFWSARMLQHQAESSEAQPWLEAAQTAAPNSYYGARAAEELGSLVEGNLPLDAPIDADDWDALEAWIAGWSPLPDAEAIQATREHVENSGFVERAVELHAAGLENEAEKEWDGARNTWAEDPLKLMFLAQQAYEHHVPIVAMEIAEQLAELSPSHALPLPETLLRLMFPAPYTDIVLDASHSYNVDPRLLYALMRQESRFDPSATSWVGARGLTQIMPTTGEGIAQNLGVDDFHIDDLYQPDLNIRFGSYYISQQIKRMEGNVQAGLAAYNGGAGNAQRWAGGTYVADEDRFTEIIDFAETRGYVKKVYGYYGAYRRLYALP